jgi:diaminopimelate decarboxylase
MHSFHYRHDKLYCEDVDLARVAEEFGTPTYVYSAGTILDHYMRLDAALAPLDHLICYAVKANSNRAILNLLVRAGAGFDIVSGGELFRVLAAGGDPAKCTFAGVGKSRDEIEYALDQHVNSFNVESEVSWSRSSASPAQRASARQSHCASTLMSTRTRTSTFRPAPKRTSSASQWIKSGRFMNARPE